MDRKSLHASAFQVALAASCLVGCGEPPPVAVSCSVATVGAPIFGGDTHSLLALTQQQEELVVEFVDAEGYPFCSGTIINPEQVLTAAHCQSPHLAVRGVHGGTVATGEMIEVAAFEIHPSIDIAVATLSTPVVDLANYPAVAKEPLEKGDVAVIAGYGVTETLEIGLLRFAAVEIAQQADPEYTVWASSIGGACIGDSGGPLMWRDMSGQLTVYGLLSGGASSCRGEDTYVRLDNDDWLNKFAFGNSRSLDCSQLPQEGACFHRQLATWCEQSEPIFRECEDGQKCGWSSTQGGLRCVEETEATCGELGHCVGTIATWCEGGETLSQECGSQCGGRCVRDPGNGRVRCDG